MTFTSLEFILFLLVTLALYFSIRRENFRQYLLLAASSAFYGFWDTRFLLLLWGAIVVAFAAGRAIEHKPRYAREALWISISSLLALLGVFKYFGFFTRSAYSLLTTMGLHADGIFYSIVLPVGISFYIFQAISYVIDVHRGVLPAEKNLMKVGLYISFFPQLVAGPIIRAADFLPQLENQPTFDTKRYLQGLREITIGFIYKSVFADNLSKVVDPVFAEIATYSNMDLIAASIGFYGQIYFDFAGYSLMAIGVARLLGYDFPVNFAYPYRAFSVTDFWRRWHISLSGWLRDYLYISLGGNRRGTLRRYRNLMLTMLLGGLWHGASWAFVAWGGLHGLALVLHRIYTRGPIPHTLSSVPLWIRIAGSWALTQGFVLLCWIPFRLNDVSEALEVLSAFGGLRHGPAISVLEGTWMLLLLPILVDTFGMSSLDRGPIETSNNGFRYWPLVYCLVLGALFALALILIPLESAPFIYFQF